MNANQTETGDNEQRQKNERREKRLEGDGDESSHAESITTTASRNKLQESFWRALADDFEKEGKATIARLREQGGIHPHYRRADAEGIRNQSPMAAEATDRTAGKQMTHLVTVECVRETARLMTEEQLSTLIAALKARIAAHPDDDEPWQISIRTL